MNPYRRAATVNADRAARYREALRALTAGTVAA